MIDVEPGPPLDQHTIYTTVANMLSKNDWQLISAEELARRVALALVPEAQAPAADTPARPWRRAGRAAGGHASPMEAAALRLYSEQLYLAFSDSRDEERQRRAYFELHRYARRAAARYGPELSSDEREEIAVQALSELYCRHVAGLASAGPEVAGAFIAIVLQHVRNAVRLWRARVGPWVPLEADESGHGGSNGHGQLPERGIAYNPAIQAELQEQREQIVRAFQRALTRSPRARIQLYAAWLRLMENLSYTTIADILKLTVGHARTMTSRGLSRLKGDPDLRIYAYDEALLDGEQPPHTIRPTICEERELGNA